MKTKKNTRLIVDAFDAFKPEIPCQFVCAPCEGANISFPIRERTGGLDTKAKQILRSFGLMVEWMKNMLCFLEFYDPI